MWATTHIRGKFFTGLRTTSRCETLHLQVARFVKSGCSIKEFLYHFCWWMGLLRNNEAKADYYTFYGIVQVLERSGATVYTREVFCLFRSLLLKASSVIIVDWRETSYSVNYDVQKYCELTRKRIVSYWPGNSEFSGDHESKRGTYKVGAAGIGLPFAACGDLGDFKDVMEWVRNKKAKLFAKHEKNREGSSNSASEKFKTRTDAISKDAMDKKKK
ncbi:hypothetical protein Ahy_A03g014875 isoform A [Arachis hypogaea]|uniref:Protein FAR1-RELATED SEQUENCE n=1 Tax=Arachis hypogaea TaxID=3818 RepID=A0A445DYZ8_ARAHY|nr:hypothetical protein Ahy_A03g014875 isoform A [Arachis hypogaea]